MLFLSLAIHLLKQIGLALHNYESTYKKVSLDGIMGNFYPGGLHIGLCDGSVRFISESMSFETWWRLARHDDGEVLSEDF